MSQKNMIGELFFGSAVGLPLICSSFDFCYSCHQCSNAIVVISAFILYVHVMSASVQSAALVLLAMAQDTAAASM